MKNSNGNTDRLIENLCYAQGIVDAFAAVLVDQDYHSEDQSLRVLYRCDDAKTAMQEAIGAIRGMREEIETLRAGDAGMVQTLQAEVRTLMAKLKEAYEQNEPSERPQECTVTFKGEPVVKKACDCFIPHDGGRCTATKELDPVDCFGDESKCVYRNLFGTRNGNQGGTGNG